MEFYLNDFSAGLVTKNVYGRTDLDIKNKGLKDIKGAIPNMFGNITNFDFDFTEKINIPLYPQFMEDLKNNNFIYFTRENKNYLCFITEVTSTQVEITIMDLILFNIKSCIINSTQGFSNSKVLCYIPSIDSVFFTGSQSMYVKVSSIINRETISNLNGVKNNIKDRPSKSELVRLNSVWCKPDSAGSTKIATDVKFSYDPRNNYATLVFTNVSSIHPSDTPFVITSDRMEDYEIEISFGKFQYSGYGDKWTVIKAPIKDTLKVASDGTITVEELALKSEDLFCRNLYTIEDFNNLEDGFMFGNRLCLVKNNKIIMSKVSNYYAFANVENGDTEGVVIDLPFEEYIKSCAFDDLILFSNRGVFNTRDFITPTNTNLKFITSVVADKKLPISILYNGINFVNKDKDEVYNLGFNGETQIYECSKISATIDLKNISNVDMITSNDKTNEALLITDENRTYLFNYNVIEQIKFWTSFDKKDFLFSIFNSDGNLDYISIVEPTTEGGLETIKVSSINFINKGFYINLFKPDANKGQVKPFFFDRNKIVKEIEILYNGTGIISIKDELGTKKPILDKRLGIGTFHRNFSGELEILKSPVNWQWGNEMILEIETTEEFTIYAINLKFE